MLIGNRFYTESYQSDGSYFKERKILNVLKILCKRFHKARPLLSEYKYVNRKGYLVFGTLCVISDRTASAHFQLPKECSKPKDSEPIAESLKGGKLFGTRDIHPATLSISSFYFTNMTVKIIKKVQKLKKKTIN